MEIVGAKYIEGKSWRLASQSGATTGSNGAVARELSAVAPCEVVRVYTPQPRGPDVRRIDWTS